MESTNKTTTLEDINKLVDMNSKSDEAFAKILEATDELNAKESIAVLGMAMTEINTRMTISKFAKIMESATSAIMENVMRGAPQDAIEGAKTDVLKRMMADCVDCTNCKHAVDCEAPFNPNNTDGPKPTNKVEHINLDELPDEVKDKLINIADDTTNTTIPPMVRDTIKTIVKGEPPADGVTFDVLRVTQDPTGADIKKENPDIKKEGAEIKTE